MRKIIKLNYILYSILFILFLLINDTKSNENTFLYGEISAVNYLTGKFNPSKNSTFISIQTLKIPINNKPQYLRKDVAIALKRLYTDFHKEYPEFSFWIQSSTRNFYSQKNIWESKWNGEIKVNGKKLNKTINDPLKRAYEILKFSSMPGTSRHHWGTDFDINVLTNDYYQSGNGKIIYLWMLKNAKKYGFYQPYTKGRKKGYNEEKWHWSYIPIAKKLLDDWNLIYKSNPEFFRKKDLFSGAEYAGQLASIYVNSINPDCK